MGGFYYDYMGLDGSLTTGRAGIRESGSSKTTLLRLNGMDGWVMGHGWMDD